MRQHAADLGIGDHISLLGERDDVPALLAVSDILLSTTLREGLPGAIIEAAAAGLPSVVSRIAPNVEVASLLPSVMTVPLAAADEVWADTISEMLAKRVDGLQPAVVRAWFEASPFALCDHGALDELWS